MKKINKKITIAFLIPLMFGLTGLLSALTVSAAGPSTVNLGSSGDFVILAKTAITTTGVTALNGDMGVSPSAASSITGFGLILDSTNTFSKSSLITGNVYAADYTAPTPTKMTTAISDMEAAYTQAAGKVEAPIVELGAGNIGGLTLAPGLYKWGTSVTIPSDVTLSGGANDIWIFQIAGDLNIASAKKVILAGGANASNIFWQIGGGAGATLGTNSSFSGNILSLKQINILTGAVLQGRALSQTQVTLQANTVSKPSASAPQIVEEPSNHQSPGSLPTPVVVNNTSSDNGAINNNNSAVVVTSDKNDNEGCSSGNLFNIMNGQTCQNNSIAINEGCSAGNLFNTANGHICNNNTVSTSVKYNFDSTHFVLGSKGENVKELQKLLNREIDTGLVLDGILGPKTTIAIKKWQTSNGLVSDGLVGVKTKAKMNLINN